jgi:membrane protein implicated in regulation of membrane protease activity
MFKLLQYYSHYQGVRGSLGSMPRWARTLVAIFALPGILLIALSLIAFCVSLLALLLLTVPVYRLLTRLTVSGAPASGAPAWSSPMPGEGITVDANTAVLEASQAASDQPRRQVEVRIVE